MARDHDTDPNPMPTEHGTDPNYPPLPVGDRPSFGKLNYGAQMRAETDPNFLTPPGGLTAPGSKDIAELDAPIEGDPITANPVASGPDSRGARRARHQAPPRALRAGNNDTMPMEPPVMLNETVPLADALAAPEVIARRERVMRRDQLTEVNESGRRRKDKRLLGAAMWGLFAATIVIVICEYALK